jgi:outer membrane protein assembly factor BamA
LDIDVVVDAGPRAILSDIVVEGADPEKPIVARAIALKPGAPVDPGGLRQTRVNLYDSGLYRSVDVVLQPADGGSQAAASTTAPVEQPVIARILVQERPRYRFRYGLAYTDEVVRPDQREQHLGGAADLEMRQLIGVGSTIGLSARLRQDFQVGRLYVGSNRFFGLPLRSNLFFSRSREQTGSTEALPFVSDVTEIFAEQTYRVRRSVELRYGYGMGQNRTTIEAENVEFKVRVARLTSSGLIDRRDNPFDPTRGWFSVASVELSRPGLGSDISFLKGFLQHYQFVRIGERLVFASAVRTGLARTFEGQDLIPSERFFGGGPTTVRGYREDDLGPRSILGDAEGGRGLLLLNEELRFPIYRWVRGVGFVDLGNVYPMVGDISLGDLQIGVGVGLRLDTPVGLFRLDLGFPANPRPFDPTWRVHFGLGHAF